jgi:inner membrane protein
MGLKLIVVCGLALMMTIPTLFVFELVGERTERAKQVASEIGGYLGGQETFLGPTLSIPYDIPAQSPRGNVKHGTYLVFPAQATAQVKTHTEERHRALFKVPVYSANLQLDATFDLTGVPEAAPQGAVFDWSRAEMIVGVSDARGAQDDAKLMVGGKTETLVPAENTLDLAASEDQVPQIKLTFFGAKVDPVAKPNGLFNVTAALQFSGAQRIAVLAYGKTTHLKMEGDWANPGFDGEFLPASQSVTEKGFSAEWTVPYIARGTRAEGPSNAITGLSNTELGVSFVELVDPYQSVNRSLKYVALFLGLVFLTYFIFEVTTGRRVHPAQYVLVGVAQIIFYLLLLSLAERIGFDLGFLIAGAATVTLLSANARWIFKSRKEGAKAFAVFALLYALIYLLLRLEDNALLVGAVASFVAIAMAMYLTRKIDWYGSLSDKVPAHEGPA